MALLRLERCHRYAPYVCESKTEDRERRSTFSVLQKFFLFSTAMILFCVLMYIPVYNKVNDQVPKPPVAGWSKSTNRDTKIYVQPENVTTIHEPNDICPKENRKEKNKLFLLIVVCSSTVNFQQRQAIRETWGNYRDYLKLTRLFHDVNVRFKNFNATSELEAEMNATDDYRSKRDSSGYGQLLPELAKALQSNMLHSATDAAEEKRFDDEKMLPEFDMNKVLGDQEDSADFDYDYGNNIMKIPPKGYEDTPDVDRIMSLLKHIKTFTKTEPAEIEPTEPEITERDFKLVFLLGMPSEDNITDVQEMIDAESEAYSDIIQEGFVDSYNNLTLKSIMLLKWVTNNCNQSVRYILKTDDDMYINVPKLVSSLRAHASAFDHNHTKAEKYLLMGDLICNARPVRDSTSKWYSPRYMYSGPVYPRYLSGTGYAFSAPAAKALYITALRTALFHLEDVFITGMCAARARPRLEPRDEPGFSYHRVHYPTVVCTAYELITSHRISPKRLRVVHTALQQPATLNKCERQRQLKAKLASLPPAPSKEALKGQKRRSMYKPRCK